MKHKKLYITLSIVVLIAFASIVSLLLVQHSDANRLPLSKSMQQQVTFAVLYPTPGQGYSIVPSQTSYDALAQVVHLTAKSNTTASQIFTITEQTEPSPFIDLPQYLPKLATVLNTYLSFANPEGQVYLTKPKELNGDQSAMFVGQGTLMFVKPSASLSDNQWRQFFLHMNVQS